MSLKNFHIFFVICSSLFCWGTAYLLLSGLPDSGTPSYLTMGIICCLGGVILPIYGTFFYKKMVKMGLYK